MNIFNSIILLIIILFGVLGLKRGMLKQLIMFGGSILIFVIAFLLKDLVASFLASFLPAINIRSSFGIISSINILFYQLLAFLLLIIVLHFILKIIASLSGIFGKLMDLTIVLALPNKLVGLILGLLEGYILVYIALNVLIIPLSNNELFMDSSVRSFIMNKTPVLSESFRGLDTIFEVDKSKNENELNKDIITTMLDRKLVTVDYIKKMRDDGLLKDVSDLDQIIIEYEEEE